MLIDNIIENIKPQEYEKYWSLKLSLLTAFIIGEYYTNLLESDYQQRFSKAIIIFREGYVSCFLKSKDRERFAKQRIKHILGQDNGINEFCQDLKQGVDSLAETINILEKQKVIDYRLMQKFIRDFSKYNGLHITPRHLADFSNKIKKGDLDKLKKVRVYSENIHYQVERLFQLLLNKAVNKKNKQHLELCCFKKELLNYLKNGSFPSVTELQSRFKRVALIFTKNKINILKTKSDVDRLEDSLTRQTNTTILSGQTAYKGKVFGLARIILDPSKCKDFKTGEVLITGMTRPDFVPLIKKASAIVTDAGGLLCHAAIVAREMKKPCLIGTKLATSMFKDGDRVEVDANKGVIRKL